MRVYEKPLIKVTEFAAENIVTESVFVQGSAVEYANSTWTTEKALTDASKIFTFMF